AVGGAARRSFVAVSTDLLSGLGVDQRLQDESERLADEVEVTAGAQCIQEVGQGRLAEGHRGELLGVDPGRTTLSFTRWPSPCEPAGQGPLKVHHYLGRLLRRVPAQAGRGGIKRDGGDTAVPVEGLVPE